MAELRARRAGPVVLSLNVQAALPSTARRQGGFEVLVRHLYSRMLHNEALGEDAASRAVQLLFAIALPGALVALFLLPAYHQPPERARTFWPQAADHLFYVTYALVVMGMALISQWEMLFPDLLDAQVLLPLPLGRKRLLLARATALTCFLLIALVGGNGLGALFFPAAADLPMGFLRHVAAHCVAVGASGLTTVAALVALQALVVCAPQPIAESLSSVVRSAAVFVLLTTLFLFPLTAHILQPALAGHFPTLRLFPPFWFLGIYECALYGQQVPPVFHALARTGWAAALVAFVAAALLYPLAHAIRLRRLVEGPALHRGRTGVLRRLGQRTVRALVRRPEERATFCFAAQTLCRLPRLQLSLAMYAGAGCALLLSGLLAFAGREGRMHVVLAESGVRTAVPIAAFLSIAALRTAFASPVGVSGRWVFLVTGGGSRVDELAGAERLAAGIGTAVTLAVLAVLFAVMPPHRAEAMTSVAEVVLAVALPVLLCDVFFLPVRTLPFTAAPGAAFRRLPLQLVRTFVVFPAFVLWIADRTLWMGASARHTAEAAVACVAAHLLLRRVRRAVLHRGAAPEDLLFTGLQLRD